MNDTIHNIAHTTIGAGTVVSLTTPDHTTQWVTLAVQLISLLIVIFKPRNQQNN